MIVSRMNDDGTQDIIGLSTDTKPVSGVAPFSTFYETDAKNAYVYDGAAWCQL